MIINRHIAVQRLNVVIMKIHSFTITMEHYVILRWNLSFIQSRKWFSPRFSKSKRMSLPFSRPIFRLFCKKNSLLTSVNQSFLFLSLFVVFCSVALIVLKLSFVQIMLPIFLVFCQQNCWYIYILEKKNEWGKKVQPKQQKKKNERGREKPNVLFFSSVKRGTPTC